jgi:hypothetical protein
MLTMVILVMIVAGVNVTNLLLAPEREPRPRTGDPLRSWRRGAGSSNDGDRAYCSLPSAQEPAFFWEPGSPECSQAFACRATCQSLRLPIGWPRPGVP